MDFKIANAFNLSPELVMFNRRAYEEEISSMSSDELGRGGLPGCSYGGYFPEMPHDDLGSDGNHSPGGCRHDSGDEAGCNIDDDFSHALFAQEQMMMDRFENAEPTQLDHSFHSTTTSDSESSIQNILGVVQPDPPQPVNTAVKCPPLVELEINYSPSPSESNPSDTPIPGLMVPSELDNSPLDTLLRPRLYDTAVRRRQVDIAAWQRVLLLDSFRADLNQPRRQRLRELSERTHLPISIISIWFAEKRRSLRLRLKFGFSFPGSFSCTSRTRTPGITTIGHGRCN